MSIRSRGIQFRLDDAVGSSSLKKKNEKEKLMSCQATFGSVCEHCVYNKLIINALITAKINNNRSCIFFIFFFDKYWHECSPLAVRLISFGWRFGFWLGFRLSVFGFRFGFGSIHSFRQRVKWKQKFKTRFRAYFWLIYAFDLNSPCCWLRFDRTLSSNYSLAMWVLTKLS